MKMHDFFIRFIRRTKLVVSGSNRIMLFFFLLCLSFLTYAETISFKADSMQGTAGSKSDTTTLEGNAFVKTQDMEISAQTISLSGSDFRFINAQTKVSVVNSKTKMEFTCDRLFYDRESKTARLQGKVHLNDTENKVTADAQIIEYDEHNETAVLQINVNLQQKNNTCTGAYAVYKKTEQLLELSGSPKIVQGNDTFKAQEITLNMNTQEITMSGRVQGSISTTQNSSKSSNQQ